MDRSMSIRESVHDVKLTLLIALVLVIAVIFVFLRSITATIIPSLTLPVSLIATFAVMYLLDYSLDNLSLMALTLCIGFVVDDTISCSRTSGGTWRWESPRCGRHSRAPRKSSSRSSR
jgi:HAE1 family hydrophobic/amphiphilic exporter-1